MTDTYRVVTHGLIVGADAEAAAQRLTMLLDATRDQIAPILTKVSCVVRKNMAPGDARSLQSQLEKAGMRCWMEVEEGEHDSCASNPGRLALSMAKLEALQPEMADPSYWERTQYPRADFIEQLTWGLMRADGRAAVVVDAGGLIAAYSDDLDCAVLLCFPPALLARHGWKKGTRLLSVNMYQPNTAGFAPDLTPGPNAGSEWGNFWPLIADLLTDDKATLAATTANIDEEEWQRAFALGMELASRRAFEPRNGLPLTSYRAGAPAAPGSAVSVSAPIARPLTIALISLGLAGWAAAKAGPPAMDLAFAADCFAVLGLAAVGLYNAFKAYQLTRKRHA